MSELNDASPPNTETAPATNTSTVARPKKKAVRRIVRKKRGDKRSQKDDDDSDVVDPVLLEKIITKSSLPKAYSFEIVKTLKRINQILQSKRERPKPHKEANDNISVHIALQMPEGLLLYATVLSDVLQRLVAATNTSPDGSQQALLRVTVLGDVTYGACCVDDLGARALGCDLLVHYGHSCLVPIQHTAVPCLYVFVEITTDVPHLVECFHKTILENPSWNGKKPHVYLLGTIQFRHAFMEARRLLRSEEYGYEITIPQAKPLSPGEVLGCTSPTLNHTDESGAVVLFVADGRFHLESTMISNPKIAKFYRYDPYPKTLTEESYDHIKMKTLRYDAIQKARLKIQSNPSAVFGIILGTLGRQGNPALLTKIQTQLRRQNFRSFVILASEITPSKLALFRSKVDAWVQIACPRLSVDWGHALSADATIPVLNPYELFVCFGQAQWREDPSYPMDYYSQDGGPWSNYHDVDNKGREFTLPQVTPSC
jgi:2-(3-amino-3-carboxypropyl)histidine synthase